MTFENCDTHEKFLNKIIGMYFESADQRIKEAALAVYLAYRDHYPKYLTACSKTELSQLEIEIARAPGKIKALSN